MLQFFFFNYTATTEIYTLSLHDALPIFTTLSPCLTRREVMSAGHTLPTIIERLNETYPNADRKSTRLNSSHANISYAVFCLKNKNNRSTLANSFEYRIRPNIQVLPIEIQ